MGLKPCRNSRRCRKRVTLKVGHRTCSLHGVGVTPTAEDRVENRCRAALRPLPETEGGGVNHDQAVPARGDNWNAVGKIPTQPTLEKVEAVQ